MSTGSVQRVKMCEGPSTIRQNGSGTSLRDSVKKAQAIQVPPLSARGRSLDATSGGRRGYGGMATRKAHGDAPYREDSGNKTRSRPSELTVQFFYPRPKSTVVVCVCCGSATPKYTGVKSTLIKTGAGWPDASVEMRVSAGTSVGSCAEDTEARTLNTLCARAAASSGSPTCGRENTGALAFAPCSVSTTPRTAHGTKLAELSIRTIERSSNLKEPSGATVAVATVLAGGTLTAGGRGYRSAMHRMSASSTAAVTAAQARNFARRFFCAEAHAASWLCVLRDASEPIGEDAR